MPRTKLVGRRPGGRELTSGKGGRRSVMVIWRDAKMELLGVGGGQLVGYIVQCGILVGFVDVRLYCVGAHCLGLWVSGSTS